MQRKDIQSYSKYPAGVQFYSTLRSGIGNFMRNDLIKIAFFKYYTEKRIEMRNLFYFLTYKILLQL